MGQVDVLLGLQWGDEGKGKIVDVLAKQYGMVARFQGGPNAGHTLEFDGRKHVLHQIPSGIFHPHIQNLIGNGVVLDPVVLLREIAGLEPHGVDVSQNLFLSRKTQIILPTHKLLDAASEKSMGDKKIGSTLRGIGPAYQDKIGRSGLRVGDLQDSARFREKFDALTARHMRQLESMGGVEDLPLNAKELTDEFLAAIEGVKKLNIVDGEYFVNQALEKDIKVLAEGAQGSLLDIDYGTYPFVTSSNTTVAGACTGLGIAPQRVGRVIGIFKAYSTRVGSGPFPTELFDDDGERLRERGREFGSTTGRPRRCGWMDLPIMRYALMLNGVTELLMMKADVLDGFEYVKACTGYQYPDGSVSEQVPYDLCEVDVTPVYESLPGWSKDIRGLREFDHLPVELRDYVGFLEEKLSVPITVVSTGPDRTETVIRPAAALA